VRTDGRRLRRLVEWRKWRERRQRRQWKRWRELERWIEQRKRRRDQQRKRKLPRSGAAFDLGVVPLVLVELRVDVRSQRLLRRLVLQHVDQHVPGSAEHLLGRGQ
jgi:hypothetical protein